jgi:hypothetical protein
LRCEAAFGRGIDDQQHAIPEVGQGQCAAIQGFEREIIGIHCSFLSPQITHILAETPCL